MTDNSLKTLSATMCAIVIAYTPVIAGADDDAPGATDITMEEARDAVKDAGYTRINSIEFDDGTWEVEAYDEEGRKVEVKVDASTGEVIKIER